MEALRYCFFPFRKRSQNLPKRNQMLKFEKVYYVDTNVILQNHKSIEELANDNNLVVITSTVLQELDRFKIGGESANYQARQFNRFLADANIIKREKDSMVVRNGNTHLLMTYDDDRIADRQYSCNDDKIIDSILYWQKIIKEKYSPSIQIAVSNDILFRTKAFLRGIQAEPLFLDKYNTNLEFKFEHYNPDQVLPNKDYFSKEELEKFCGRMIADRISFVKIIDNTGRPFLFVREDQNMFKRINDSNFYLFNLKPKNSEQTATWELMLNPRNDIVVIDSIAGTGKTLSALVCALELVRMKEFSKITYIRKTIISGNRMDELGFLPGSLSAKLSGYLHPMRDNIELLVKLKNKRKKNWSQGDVEAAINAFENEYNINYEYLGHARGRNLSGVIIIDEAQNFEIADLITLLSRVTEDSKVFIIGSTKQIDHPYLSKDDNALTFMLNQAGTFGDVQVQGFKLEKVERGRITKWIENITK